MAEPPHAGHPAVSVHLPLQGYLSKMKSGKRNKFFLWTKRWFSVQADENAPGGYVFTYFKNADTEVAAKSYPMQEIEHVRMFKNGKGKESYTFSVDTADRTYILKAHSQPEMKAWIKGLNVFINVANGREPKEHLSGDEEVLLHVPKIAKKKPKPKPKKKTPAAKQSTITEEEEETDNDDDDDEDKNEKDEKDSVDTEEEEYLKSFARADSTAVGADPEKIMSEEHTAEEKTALKDIFNAVKKRDKPESAQDESQSDVLMQAAALLKNKSSKDEHHEYSDDFHVSSSEKEEEEVAPVKKTQMKKTKSTTSQGRASSQSKTTTSTKRNPSTTAKKTAAKKITRGATRTTSPKRGVPAKTPAKKKAPKPKPVEPPSPEPQLNEWDEDTPKAASQEQNDWDDETPKAAQEASGWDDDEIPKTVKKPPKEKDEDDWLDDDWD